MTLRSNALSLAMAKANALRPQARDGGAVEGVANHANELVGLNASLHILVKDTADMLVRHYPGFLWAVQPDPQGGIINITCLNFHTEYGYTIKLLALQADPKMREVIKAGAEILRRFHYPGTRFDMETANNVPRDAKGQGIPDLSDFRSSRRKDHAAVELAMAEGRATIVDINGETLVQVKDR